MLPVLTSMVLHEVLSWQTQTGLGFITMTPKQQRLKFRFTIFSGAINNSMVPLPEFATFNESLKRQCRKQFEKTSTMPARVQCCTTVVPKERVSIIQKMDRISKELPFLMRIASSNI